MIISRPITVLATEGSSNKDQKQTKNQDTSNDNNKDNNNDNGNTNPSGSDNTPTSPPPPPPEITGTAPAFQAKEIPPPCDEAADPSCKNPPQTITPPLVPPVDCKVTPTDPSCPVSTDAKVAGPGTDPDESCIFDPTQKKCAPDEQGNCPPGFAHNSKDQCFPTHKCPPGFGRQNDDESGACKPSHCTMQFPTHKCPPPHPICKSPFKLIHGRCTEFINIFINIHKHTKHISHNDNPNSMVTKDTELTPQLTVGEAIDGCKDINSKSSNDLQKSCDIFMASTFNYCQTHQSIANKDHNICSDPLYKLVLVYLKVNNVKLKLFPETIYNITP